MADDTIVAVATPPGRSAIGVVRLSGEGAPAVASRVLRGRSLQPRVATVCRAQVTAASGEVTHDEAVAVWFPAPRSYTGEHVVEISTHGNSLLLHGLVRSAQAAGARLARPGEFTLRAVRNGKKSLVQAEAVADLIDASTFAQARLAFDQLHGTLSRWTAAIDAELFDLIAGMEASLDFPEEGYHFAEEGATTRVMAELGARIDVLLRDAARGRLIREGAVVVIVGRPNVGKSSLFNALLGASRAIVAAQPGTTRDLVTERMDLDGVEVTLVDTAGARDADDPVEVEGVARGARARETADALIVVLDATSDLTGADHKVLSETQSHPARVIVWNKCDGGVVPLERADVTDLGVSATSGWGVNELRRRVLGALDVGEPAIDSPALSNVRHVGVLREAQAAIGRAQRLCEGRAPEEIVLVELHQARARLDELVGHRTSQDVLDRIFERFCIGK